MRNVTFATTQMACTADVDENIGRAEALIRKAKERDADVVLIQELFSDLYFCQVIDRDYLLTAKPEKGHPMLERMSKLARELEMVIMVTFFEQAGEARFNAGIVFDADGTNLGKYRKSHIPDDPGYYEKFYFAPGDTGFKVFDTRFGRFGLGICWDQWFPECARSMAIQGAEALFYPTAIGTFAVPPEQIDDEPLYIKHWQNVMLGHAAANVIPVVAANRIGVEKLGTTAMRFHGSSFICDQTGTIVEELDAETEGVAVHTFDLDSIADERRTFPFYRDRRPELYGRLMTLDGKV